MSILHCSTYFVKFVFFLTLYNDENTHKKEFRLHLVSKVAFVPFEVGGAT
jgi:hypothetical protein